MKRDTNTEPKGPRDVEGSRELARLTFQTGCRIEANVLCLQGVVMGELTGAGLRLRLPSER